MNLYPVLPQDLRTTASPTFAGLTLSGLTDDRIISSVSGVLTSIDLDNWIAGTANQITVTDDTDGSVTLSLPQSIDAGADVTFGTLTLADLSVNNGVLYNVSDVITANANLTFDGTNLTCGGNINAGSGKAYLINNVNAINLVGTSCISVGGNAGVNNTGSYCLFLGDNAGGSANTGDHNFCLGSYSGNSLTSGGNMVFIGSDAGRLHQTGNYCIAIGNSALRNGTANSNIIAIGGNSCFYSTGDNNIGIGFGTCKGVSGFSGSFNIGIGLNCMQSIQGSASRNIVIGINAGQAITTGERNILIGYVAGYGITTGARNTCIGHYSGYALGAADDDNIFLGYFAGRYQTGSDKLVIDNQDRTNEATEASNAIIYGVMASAPASQTLALNAATSVSQTLGVTGLSTLTGGIASGNIEPITDDTYYLGKNDDDTPKAWKGVILKDQTDGKYYRIELNSGAVSIVDLTD